MNGERDFAIEALLTRYKQFEQHIAHRAAGSGSVPLLASKNEEHGEDKNTRTPPDDAIDATTTNSKTTATPQASYDGVSDNLKDLLAGFSRLERTLEQRGSAAELRSQASKDEFERQQAMLFSLEPPQR